MSEVVHLSRNPIDCDAPEIWCPSTTRFVPDARRLADCTCLQCLLACAEYGSEARHRREVLIEGGAKL